MRTLLSRFIVVITILFLTACDNRELDLLESSDRILAFGDSLTAGVGTDKEHSYPTVLSNLSGIEVINAGVSGETTDRGLQRLPKELERYQPSLVILLEGGNDILKNRDHDLIKNNLSSMIAMIKESGAQVVLIGVPKKSLFSSSAELYHQLAEEHDLVFEDELIGGLMRSPSLKSDSVHFNAKGYREMAEAIYQLLQEKGAVE